MRQTIGGGESAQLETVVAPQSTGPSQIWAGSIGGKPQIAVPVLQHVRNSVGHAVHETEVLPESLSEAGPDLEDAAFSHRDGFARTSLDGFARTGRGVLDVQVVFEGMVRFAVDRSTQLLHPISPGRVFPQGPHLCDRDGGRFYCEVGGKYRMN